jgi:hypothetical protein
MSVQSSEKLIACAYKIPVRLGRAGSKSDHRERGASKTILLLMVDRVDRETACIVSSDLSPLTDVDLHENTCMKNPRFQFLYPQIFARLIIIFQFLPTDVDAVFKKLHGI